MTSWKELVKCQAEGEIWITRRITKMGRKELSSLIRIDLDTEQLQNCNKSSAIKVPQRLDCRPGLLCLLHKMSSILGAGRALSYRCLSDRDKYKKSRMHGLRWPKQIRTILFETENMLI